jgi:hypothetical protein
MPAQKLLLKILIYLFLFLLVSFTVYKLTPLILGPRIIINYPLSTDVVDTSTFVLRGQILRAKSAKLMDRDIVMDQAGYFNEILISQNPYSTIYVHAIDKWGRKVEAKVVVQSK